MDWKRGEVASRLSAALFLCCSSTLHCSSIAVGIKFLLGLGGWGWVLLGWTGLVLPATAQNPARLVYGSAALVASLRGQQSHFATLPKIDPASILQVLYEPSWRSRGNRQLKHKQNLYRT